jgi:hypothetical protein
MTVNLHLAIDRELYLHLLSRRDFLSISKLQKLVGGGDEQEIKEYVKSRGFFVDINNQICFTKKRRSDYFKRKKI